jgi:hypothetical protein
MGLAELQKTLALLYTDTRLREDFFADPARVGGELGLSAEETRRLQELSAAGVNKFADSLCNKRLLGVGKLLPFTRRVLKERFDSDFRLYAAEHRQAEATRYLEDAARFARRLDGVLKREGACEAWVFDLLRFEVARVLAADPRRRVVARFFRHDISRLVSSLARREETPAVVRRPSLAVWWRPRRRAAVRYALLSAPELRKR